ncbi:hypothetical protein PO124_07925 [Bacillus licheniformis]|nr:hypothetical protein [Bacillus licheniformis]
MMSHRLGLTKRKNDSTEAIQKAIDQAHQAGGGRVTVPEGVFLSGALRLKAMWIFILQRER